MAQRELSVSSLAALGNSALDFVGTLAGGVIERHNRAGEVGEIALVGAGGASAPPQGESSLGGGGPSDSDTVSVTDSSQAGGV